MVFTLSDARSFSRLTSKFPPLGSMLNFDADVKNDRASPNVKTALHGLQTSLLVGWPSGEFQEHHLRQNTQQPGKTLSWHLLTHPWAPLRVCHSVSHRVPGIFCWSVYLGRIPLWGTPEGTRSIWSAGNPGAEPIVWFLHSFLWYVRDSVVP